LIVRNADFHQPSAVEKLHGWYKSDNGFQRMYPWVLFGPYVMLVAWYFPLERGRVGLSLPVNLATLLAFLGACHLIDVRTWVSKASIVIVKSHVAGPGHETNLVQLQITKAGPGDLAWESTNRLALPHALPPALFPKGADPALTNFVSKFSEDFGPPLPARNFSQFSLWSALLDFLAYGAVLGFTHSIHFYRRFREREHRALVLETNLAHARLDTLRAQLQPHFLFNSLNAIAALLRRDPRLAEATLVSLSELLRLALSRSKTQEVALRDELEFVQRYLDIQRTRFGDKLRVEQDLAPETLECSVPTLLLQPLVENAIRHGIEPAERPGTVRLTAQKRNGRLSLTVEDDGVGLATPDRANLPENSSSSGAPVPAKNGIGLANLRARLATLYGADQELEASPRPEGGFVVRIELPWRPVVSSEIASRGK